MLPLRYAGYWRIAGIALLLLVLSFAVVPDEWLFGDDDVPKLWRIDADKWLHLGGFTLLAVWFAGQYRPRAYWQIGFGLIAYGLLIEYCQRFVGFRTADWADVAADAAGIVIGLAIATAGAGGWSQRAESWYLERTTSFE